MTKALLPNFFIIGAQKAASTNLQYTLRAHRDVCMPEEEIRFFEDPEYTTEDIGQFNQIFRGCESSLRGIKRPDYLARPEVPARIRFHVPDAKLIAILREPISRLVSAYHYYIKMGFIPAIHINEGLRRVLKGEDLGSVKTSELLEYGCYASHLERYLGLFPVEQLIILLQDDIFLDSGNVLRSVHKFLGLSHLEQSTREFKDNAGLYNLHRLKFLRLRNHFLFDYTPITQKIIPKDSKLGYLVAAGITVFDQKILARIYTDRKPELEPELKQQLKEFYEPEIRRLEGLLDRPLNTWKMQYRSI